jgi:putative transposase
VGGICYHVINRGKARARVFHDEKDHCPFLGQFMHARNRIGMRLATWRIMPNHFHFFLWPYRDGDQGRFTPRWINSHVQAHRKSS